MTEKRLHIMVVEDHQDTRVSLAEFLRLSGYWVESASDEANAVACMDREHFDVLLLDVHLLGSSGWDLLTELSKRGRRPAHVISISAFGLTETRKASEAFGCQGHLAKPFQPEALELLLKQASSNADSAA